MTLAQIVAQGVLPDLAPHSTPIADAAAVFLGSAGRAARRRRIGGLDDRQQRRSGAERIAHAVRAGRARRAAGVLCAAFIRASGRRRTPSSSRRLSRVLLALTGSFAKLAVVSALARLVIYAGVGAATLRLRCAGIRGDACRRRPSSRRSVRSCRSIAIAMSLGDGGRRDARADAWRAGGARGRRGDVRGSTPSRAQHS